MLEFSNDVSVVNENVINVSINQDFKTMKETMKETRNIRTIVDIKYHNNKRYLILNKGVKATIKEYDGKLHEGETTVILDNTIYKRGCHLLDINDMIYVDIFVNDNKIYHKISLVEKE